MADREPKTNSLLTRLYHAARDSIFGPSDAQDAGPAARAALPSRKTWDDSVALSLADLAREGTTKASGRVQILSLADFRKEIGELWEQYQDRILLIAETTIARMIGKGNTFIPMADSEGNADDIDTWLLLMPDMDVPAAAAHAADIAKRLGEKLAGARFSSEDPPVPEAATLDLTGALESSGRINLQVLRTAVRRARRAQAGATAAPLVNASAGIAPTQPRLHAAAALRPAWCVDTEMEDAFFLRPMSTTGQDLASDLKAPFPEIVATNLCALAARTLADIERKGLRAKLALPIPYAHLFSPVAANLRDAIMAMPQTLRLHHLRLEIVRTPATVAINQLTVLRELFRPTVREVAFLINPFSAVNDVYALDHIIIGADFSASRGWDESDLRTALARMSEMAKERYTYVIGLRSAAHAKIAFSAGIDEIGSDSFATDVEQLPEKLRLIPRATAIAS